MTWWDESAVLSTSDCRLIERAVDLEIAESLPNDTIAGLRRRTLDIAKATVEPSIVTGFRHSPLGPEWSSDIDIHVREMPDDGVLNAAGWHDLSQLLPRLGRSGEGRWAVAENGAVIGAADFEISPMPNPLSGALRRNTKSATLRTVLELRVLQRSGDVLPTDGSLASAAVLEQRLGGDELPSQPSAGLRGPAASAAATLRSVVPRLPRNGAGISISGVDGAGKSTVIGRLTAELALAGVPFTQIWARPGYDLGVFDAIAKSVKRLLGKQPEPGIRAVVADDGAVPESRHGAPAAIWRTLLVGEYVAKMRRRSALADGLIVYDRHVVDAEVTLAFAYGLDRPWARRVLRRLVPTPDVQVFLTIDADTAIERKPDDPMGSVAIIDQLDRYRDALVEYPDILKIDGTTPLEEIVTELWALLTVPAFSDR